ncbi:MAG: hypothetical protein ACFFA7_08310 [Promethearchaeota archaeon]
MLGKHASNNVLNKDDYKIEISHNSKEKLNVAELVLKTLGIQYHVQAPKTHTTGLLKSLLRKSLGEINDELTDFELNREDDNHGSN